MAKENQNSGKTPTLFDYIRYSLDGMKRTSSATEETNWGSISQVGKLANFTDVIITGYENKATRFDSPEKLEAFIVNIAKRVNIDSGQPLFRNSESENYIPAAEVQGKFHDFCRSLYTRIKNSNDAQETAAYIAYEMDLRGKFFADNNHMIAQALEAFALMRKDANLPIYRVSREELLEKMHHARDNQDYAGWKNFYLSQFQRLDPVQATQPVTPANAWNVELSDVLDLNSTICNRNYVLRNADELAQLKMVSGKNLQELAVFRPSRMALHETIAELVTRVQLPNPKTDIDDFIRNADAYKEIQSKVAPMDARFDEMAKRFEEYSRYIVDDHFHVLSPQLGLREVLQQQKDSILKRIKDKSYEPRAVESRQALKRLLADYMLKTHYESQIRPIIEQAIDKYLEENPERKLPLKPNADRFAWVTVGGAASGKSKSRKLIDNERSERGEFTPLCTVNPDNYRDIIMKKTNILHASHTHSETARITDIIIERLNEMVRADNGKGHAPDIWLDMVRPDEPRMKLAGHGHAQIRLYVTSCPAEMAVERSYKRATDATEADYGRYVPTTVLLQGHQEASEKMPQALKAHRVPVKMFDTSPIEKQGSAAALIFAQRREHEQPLKIMQMPGFLDMVKKTALKSDAKNPGQLYPPLPELENSMVNSMLEYVNNGVDLNFYYSDQQPQPPNSHGVYASLRKNHCIVYDLETFIKALGSESFAINLLQTLGKERDIEIDIRNKLGQTLLFAEKEQISYTSEQDLKSNIDSPEKRVFAKLKSILENLYVNRLHTQLPADQGRNSISRTVREGMAGSERGSPEEAIERSEGGIGRGAGIIQAGEPIQPGNIRGSEDKGYRARKKGTGLLERQRGMATDTDKRFDPGNAEGTEIHHRHPGSKHSLEGEGQKGGGRESSGKWTKRVSKPIKPGEPPDDPEKGKSKRGK